MNRNVPLVATIPLKPGTSRLRRSASIGRSAIRNTASRTGDFPVAGTAVSARKPIPPVSPKRARENRVRSQMADRRWPDRRDGTVMCYVPGCPLRADDLNEILPRGRGGSITDEANTIPTCRGHNEELTKSPAWAYRLGLLKHDGVCCRGRVVCSRYAEDGEVAS